MRWRLTFKRYDSYSDPFFPLCAPKNSVLGSISINKLFKYVGSFVHNRSISYADFLLLPKRKKKRPCNKINYVVRTSLFKLCYEGRKTLDQKAMA